MISTTSIIPTSVGAHAKSIIPRTSPRKPKSNKAIPPKPRYNGPVYLPKHVATCLVMMSRRNKISTTKKRRLNTSLHIPGWPRSMSKIMMRLTTQIILSLSLRIISQNDSYPMQDSDIEDLLATHGHYTAKMTSTYHISKHSASSYGL